MDRKEIEAKITDIKQQLASVDPLLEQAIIVLRDQLSWFQTRHQKFLDEREPEGK
jgi:hypothetical protein